MAFDRQNDDKELTEDIVSDTFPKKETAVSRLDRHEVNWSEGAISESLSRLPFSIQQTGSGNDLSVSINVAMLPAVEDFLGYEKALPGTAEYIKKAADEQQRHRFAIESKLVEGSERRRDRGQVLSGSLAALGFAGSIVLGLYGNGYVAALLAVVAVGGPVAAQTVASAMARRADPADRPAGRDRGITTEDETR